MGFGSSGALYIISILTPGLPGLSRTRFYSGGRALYIISVLTLGLPGSPGPGSVVVPFLL